MPKDQFPKLKATICNMSIESNDITNILPRSADSNNFMMDKLKRKLSFRGHVYLEVVSPESVYLDLSYLNKQNVFYKSITIDMGCLPNNLKNLSLR